MIYIISLHMIKRNVPIYFNDLYSKVKLFKFAKNYFRIGFLILHIMRLQVNDKDNL